MREPKFIILHDRFGREVLIDSNCITYAGGTVIEDIEPSFKVKGAKSVLNMRGQELYVSETVVEIAEKILKLDLALKMSDLQKK